MRHGHVACVLVALVGCAAPRVDRPLIVQEIPSPAGPGSGEPNLAVAPDGRVLLSWIEPAGEGRHALRYASNDGSGPWSPPRTIAEGAGWFVNWADFPALAVLPDGTMFAHWLAKSGPSTYAYDVEVASSRDGGATWSRPVVPHRDDTKTEHGFVSMTPWSASAMGVIWLDGRKTAGATHAAHGEAGAEMSLVHTTIAADGTLGTETVLDGRVCDCCQTDAARAGDAVVVVYRDRSDKEVRDVSAVRFADGQWSPPRAIAMDGWEINGCPVNGPAIAASGAKVAVAWFTAAGDKPKVKVALSDDAGVTFGNPILVDDGRPLGRVDVALLDGDDALVSWVEQGEKGAATLRIRRIARDGPRGGAATVAESTGARSSGFPRMARSGSQVILAWRDASDPPKVRTGILDVTPSAR
jgi:BNR repeat protein